MDKLSVVIPGRNESENLSSCICSIVDVLKKNQINHEVLFIDDGSSDNTQEELKKIISEQPTVRCVKNQGENGFGYAVRLGLEKFTGDAVSIMMADQSDSPNDLVKYWKCLHAGYDCAFGSRFVNESFVYDYPKIKFKA